MATRRTSAAAAPGFNGGAAPSAAPTELTVTQATPPPTTITAPDAPRFLQQYQSRIAPMERFQVIDDSTDLQCQTAFTQVAEFITEVEAAFKPSKSAAHQAHKAITALESMFTGPAERVKENLANQHLGYVRMLNERRMAEERRLQEEQASRARAEAEQRRRQLQEEEDARVAAELQRIAELPPWEQPEEEALPVAVVVETPHVEVVPIRLPSTVPIAMNGPSTRKLPWAAEVKDFKALVIAIADRCKAGDDRWLDCLEPAQVRLNQLAKDHTTVLGEILPGVVAFQGETLARR